MTVVENEDNELIPTRLVTGWHIPIDPQDQENTTFTYPYGTFAYPRMPFGLCNDPGTFQRCMMAIFYDMIKEMMEVFMENFSFFRDSFSSCLSHLDKMLKRCEDTNLVLNWEKFHFIVKEGIVLGHKISKSGIEFDRAKVNVIAKLPHPTSVIGNLVDKMRNIDGKMVREGKIRKEMRGAALSKSDTFFVPGCLEHIMLKKGFFFFQFLTREGMEKVLETSPWMIRRVPIFLNICTPNSKLTKDTIYVAAVSVKMHNVPMVAYCKEGLSLITSQIGNPIMLDAYTSTTCKKSWGKNDYARAIIKISSMSLMMHEVIVAILFTKGTGHLLEKVEVEYEWVPPREVSKTTDSMDKIIDPGDKGAIPNDPNIVKPSLKEVVTLSITVCSNSFGVFDSNVDVPDNIENDNWKSVDCVNESDSDVDELIMENENDTRHGMNFSPKQMCLSIGIGPRIVVFAKRVLVSLLARTILRPWCLLGDFNAALFLADSTVGSSVIDVSMRDFKECVDDIELDHVLGNYEFNDSFEGALAIFHPYRTSDHSSTVLKLPFHVKAKPKPFKFYNIITQRDRFKEVVKNGWEAHVSRFLMYNVVKKLKNLNKPFHSVQTDLDRDPNNISLRDEEAAYVIVYSDALLLQERFLRKKAKIQWLKEGQPSITQDLNIEDLFGTKLDENDALNMIRNVSSSKVKEAIFSMGNDKSLGLDGYTAAFLRTLGILLVTGLLQRINGSLHGYFKDKRGLRQGDPLSPYLFMMVMEILTLMLKRRVRDSYLFTYHRYCSKMELINLCFADDLFLFAHGDPDSASVIMEALDEFKFASGHVPSLPKSIAYFCNLLNHIKIVILQILPFEEGSHLV
nr:reverse transcriptase domain-containing protein [Tanacetum cinerariifolium]